MLAKVNNNLCDGVIILRQYSHNADTVEMKFPRYHNGIDLSELTAMVLLDNIDVITANVDEMLKTDVSESNILLIWKVHGRNTQKSGVFRMQVMFCHDDEVAVYTDTCLVSITESVGMVDIVPDYKISLLEQYLSKFKTLSDETKSMSDDAANAAGQAGNEADRAEVAADRAAGELEEAQALVAGFELTAQQAVADVTNAGQEQVEQVEATGNTQVADINATGTARKAEVNTAGAQQLQAVNSAGQSQKKAVEDAGAANLEAVNAAGTEQLTDVNAAGEAQVQAVRNEGAAQVANVQQAAAEIVADREQIAQNTAAIEENARAIGGDAPGIVETAEGDVISVDDSAEKPLQGLRLFGRTEQVKTTGAQLLDIMQLNDMTDNGIKTEKTADGGYKITGKTTDNSFSSNVIPVDLHPGSYLLTATKGFCYVRKTKSDGKAVWMGSKVYIEETDTDICFYITVPVGNTVNETLYPMLNAGTEPLPWEPYTGGKPSPSPDYPQEIVNVGDGGNIAVNVTDGTEVDAQSVIIPTPNGLHGIPVKSGGNYTDENGQEYIFDEIVYNADGTGQYVQRVKSFENLTFAELTLSSSVIDGSKMFFYRGTGISDENDSKKYELTSTHLPATTKILWYIENGFYAAYGNLYVRIPGINDADKINEILKDAKFLCRLKDPIITDLPAETVGALKALHTNYPTTNVMNDANARMKLTYIADTRKYMDKEHAKIRQEYDEQIAYILSLLPESVQAAIINTETQNLLESEEIV